MSQTNDENEIESPEVEVEEAVPADDTDLDDDIDIDLEDDEVDEDVETDADESNEPAKDTDKQNLSAIAQKKKWRERALAAEAKLKRDEPAAKSSEATQPKSRSKSDENVLINFRLDNPELKSKEVGEIDAYARASGKTLEEALDSDIIRIMIARNRKKIQQQGGSISPNRRSQPTKPAKDWTKMGRTEMEAEAARLSQAKR